MACLGCGVSLVSDNMEINFFVYLHTEVLIMLRDIQMVPGILCFERKKVII